jgi:hypothetical protein
LDRSKFNELDHTHNIYLLLFYKDDHKYDDCGNVQNLNIDAISWVSEHSGSMSTYVKAVEKSKNRHNNNK